MPDFGVKITVLEKLKPFTARLTKNGVFENIETMNLSLRFLHVKVEN